MKTINKKYTAFAIFVVLMCFTTTVYANGGSVDFYNICYDITESISEDKNELGEWMYKRNGRLYCRKDEIDEMWDRFDFDKHNWDDGFGYYSMCNLRRPLARTFNGLSFLKYAGGRPYCSKFDRFNMLPWAYCYSGNAIDELDAECTTQTSKTTARTRFGRFVDNYTNLYYRFFYKSDPMIRASIIVHEARHAEGWCSHQSCCAAGSRACDKNFYYGCTGRSSSFGIGAYGLEVVYLQHIALYKKPRQSWRIKQVIDLANRRLKRNFCEAPHFKLDVRTGYTKLEKEVLDAYGDL